MSIANLFTANNKSFMTIKGSQIAIDVNPTSTSSSIMSNRQDTNRLILQADRSNTFGNSELYLTKGPAGSLQIFTAGRETRFTSFGEDPTDFTFHVDGLATNSDDTAPVITNSGTEILKIDIDGISIKGGEPIETYGEERLETTASGPFAASAMIIDMAKIGKIVVLSFPALNVSATSSAKIAIADPLPVEFRPSSRLDLRINVENAGASVPGSLTVETTGTMEFSMNNGEAYTFPGSCGFQGFGTSYVQAIL